MANRIDHLYFSSMISDAHQLARTFRCPHLSQQKPAAILINTTIHNRLHDFLHRHLNASRIGQLRQLEARDGFLTPPRCFILLAMLVANPRSLQSRRPTLLLVLLHALAADVIRMLGRRYSGTGRSLTIFSISAIPPNPRTPSLGKHRTYRVPPHGDPGVPTPIPPACAGLYYRA